uniref:Uncharacterized protein n=1 Tax=Chrysodeixis includens nucleopolyhedrovirus TaxID=1207438 RepID=A0A6B9CNX8_9ABAC|nr:hypothetical protein [Chrysodeixis includens nucleopolyhedrovirus]
MAYLYAYNRILKRELKNNYIQLRPSRIPRQMSSLEELCLKAIAEKIRRPFRKIKTLSVACAMRDNILLLNLPKIYTFPILEIKLKPVTRQVNENIILKKECEQGHVVTSKKNNKLFINYFCNVCASNVF